MKKIASLLLVLALLATLPLAAGAQGGAPADPEASAKAFLDALPAAVPLTPEQNLIGFSIDRIEQDGDDYVVYWRSTNDLINQNSSNVAYTFSLIRFYDPADLSRSYQGFEVVDGKLSVSFEAGETIAYDHVRVRFTTPSRVVYLSFSGAPDGPEQLYTVPLFYTLILDDNPRVYEDTPRAAGTLFAQ